VPVTVRKPSSDEWITWAMEHGIEPEVCAWVKQFPHSMASYMDEGQGDNPYIFNPKKVQQAYVSPRSLETASNIIGRRSQLDQDTVISALTGAIGESASRDMQAFIEYADQLPTWESVISSPTTATVPSSAGACAVMVYGAIAKVDKTSMDKFMVYLERMGEEWQACFCINIAKTTTKQAVAFSSKKFSNWVTFNQDLL